MATSLQIPKIEDCTFTNIKILSEFEADYLVGLGMVIIEEIPLGSYLHVVYYKLDRIILHSKIKPEYALTKEQLDSYTVIATKDGVNKLIRVKDLVKL